MMGQHAAPEGRRDQLVGTTATRTETTPDVERLWLASWAPLFGSAARPGA